MKNKKLTGAILTLLVTLVLFILYINFQFKNIKQSPFTQSSQKNWSHRGYAKTEKKENTVNAIEMALENGYQGVEIDLWFNKGEFYLSHDENYSDTLPKLKDVFSIFPENYFWLDLKNLSYSNYKTIAYKLEQFEKSKNSYFIESKQGLPLGLLHSKGFQTSYWLTNGNFIRQFIQKCWMVIFEYNGISMPAKTYQQKSVRSKYKHLNIHLWDKHPSSQIYQWEEVKIILDDNELY